MNIRKASRSAFTLIEMLMVIVIIFILSLVVFRMMKMLDDKAKVAETVYVLKQVQNALSEYKMEYGIYPPVHIVEYEYESTSNQTAWFNKFLSERNDVTDTDGSGAYPFWSDRGDDEAGDQGPREVGQTGWTGHSKYPSEWHLHYKYGLVAHLDTRRRGGQAHWYDKDTERDLLAKQKWAGFMKGRVSTGGKKGHDVTSVVGQKCVFTNKFDTINDGFGVPIKYECRSPYSSYRLWSTSKGGIDSASVGGL